MITTPISQPQKRSVWLLATLSVAIILLVLSSAILALHRSGYRVLPSKNEALKNIRHEAGFLYVAVLGTTEYSQHTGASIAVVLEDGKPLPISNIEHSIIRDRGEGRFSFWHHEVFFSASDSTSPLENGREYIALYPIKIPPVVPPLLYSVTAITVIVFLALLTRNRRLILHLLGIDLRADGSGVFSQVQTLSTVVWKWRDPLVCALLVVTTLIVRWNTSQMIQTGGDATNYWAVSASLTSGDGVSSWHHKSARFGILLPVAVVQLLFGYEPINFYIAPLVFWALLTPLTYLTGKQIANRSVGLLAALSLLGFSQLDECASQVLPSIFETVYLLLTFYLLSFISKGWKGTGLLLVALISFFLSYGSKETNIFFVPGICLFLLIKTRSLPRSIQFGVGVCVLIACETAFYYYYAGISGGRLGVMSRSHLEVMTTIEPSITSLIVGRFLNLPGEWLYVYGAFLLSCLYLPLSKHAREIGGMSVGVVSFVLLMLCAVKKLDPLTPAVRFLPRYLDVTAPLVALVVFKVIFEWLGCLMHPLARLMQINPTILPRVSAIIVGIVISISATARFQPTPFQAVREYTALIEKSLSENRPIVLIEEKANRTLARLMVGAYRTPLYYESVSVGTTQVYVATKVQDPAIQTTIQRYLHEGVPVTLLKRDPLEVLEITLSELIAKK